MASSSKFTLLETTHLASQPPSTEVTMQNLIDTSERMAEEAKEIMPYSFDECTYVKGSLRQSIWSCMDCGEKGVCYGCSISCHSDHRLVELWVKRSFRCDCPTISMPPTTSTGKRRRCTLNRPEAQPQQPNEDNRYNQNFGGRFCRCERAYDPETESEAMLSCMVCEDWFHESCLNLRHTSPKAETEDDEDEDEEAAVLIPSDTYDGLICAGCVQRHPFVRDRAGKDGWMVIEPDESGSSWKVVGRRTSEEEKKPDVQQEEVIADGKPGPGGLPETVKRPVEDGGEERDAKRSRLEEGGTAGALVEEGVVKSESTAVPGKPILQGERSSKGAGDVFLSYGIRDQLKASLDARTIASLPFPLDDAETYEPPKDDHEDETLDEVTNRVVGSLPRVQAIEALHGYQSMKDKLKTMLTAHAQAGQTVSKDDIDSFFAELKEQRAQ